MWVVRAGEGGGRFEDFEQRSLVTIGWGEMGDLRALRSRDELMERANAAYPSAKKFSKAIWVGQVFRFVSEIRAGDCVVTYNPAVREYLVGTIAGDYEYVVSGGTDDHPNRRKVSWRGRVMRDSLSVRTRNSLGAISTLFLVPEEAAVEIESLLTGERTQVESIVLSSGPAAEDEVEDIYRDLQAKAFEFIKDKVSQLDWDDMQELVAGLLRSMGYKTRVSPSGSDRGKDIVASPDGLGFEDPRIVVEVKHRSAAIGSQDLRSFIGGRHDSDKGLYVSTGGFTKDARYEAERGRIPVTLIDLDDLVHLLLEHYASMDADSQRLIPLRRLYWPA